MYVFLPSAKVHSSFSRNSKIGYLIVKDFTAQNGFVMRKPMNRGYSKQKKAWTADHQLRAELEVGRHCSHPTTNSELYHRFADGNAGDQRVIDLP